MSDQVGRIDTTAIRAAYNRGEQVPDTAAQNNRRDVPVGQGGNRRRSNNFGSSTGSKAVQDGDEIAIGIRNGNRIEPFARIYESPGWFSADAYFKIDDAGTWKFIEKDGDNLNIDRFGVDRNGHVIVSDKEYSVKAVRSMRDGSEYPVRTEQNGRMYVTLDDNHEVTLEDWACLMAQGDI